MEVFHGNKIIVSTTPQQIETTGIEDPAPVPYAGELTLASMPKGHYLLRLTITDRVTKSTAHREVSFEVD